MSDPSDRLDKLMVSLAEGEGWSGDDAGLCPTDEILAAFVERRGPAVDSPESEALVGHLAACDVCRPLAAELVLDGAGESLPSPSLPTVPAAGGPAWWESLLELFPGLPRPAATLASLLLVTVAVTAVAAPMAWYIVQKVESAKVPEPAPVSTPTPTTRSRRINPVPEAIAPTPPGVPAEPEAVAPARPAVAPALPPEPRSRPHRPAAARAPETTAEIEPAAPARAALPAPPAMAPPPAAAPAPFAVQEDTSPASPPPSPPTAVRLFEDAMVSYESKRYREAMDRFDLLLAIPPDSHLAKLARRMRLAAERQLRGACQPGYIREVVRTAPNTTVERCVLE